MTPQENYLAALENTELKPDDAQAMAIQQLDKLYHSLQIRTTTRNNGLGHFFRRKSLPAGLYLWGGTGRGKTHLMDSFYSCLDFPDKHRLHFHHFMRDIHAQVREHPHIEDPLKVIAKEWASKYRILCLDEFHVTDITDAMILARLLDALFSNGVVLVTTSNFAINELYKDGLQRSSFLPAIDLLHRYTDEIALGNGTDYRFEYLDQVKTYYTSHSDNDQKEMEEHFARLADVTPKHNRHIVINDRKIKYLALANNIIWFDFSELCRTARSAIDYIEIAQCYSTVFISYVRQMNDEQNDVARRFLHLIDALYDHSVKVIISADATAASLYTGNNMAFSFERAVSRLSEMATSNYLSKAHH